MKSLFRMTWMEAKLFLREPASAFFSLIFPLLMLVIFGTIYSSQPTLPGMSSSQEAIGTLIPGFTAMIIGMIGLMPVTITLATYRENGILRRLRTTPISPLAVLAAQVMVVFSMTCLGMVLLLIAGRLLYHIEFPEHPFSVILGFFLGSLSFFGMGFVLAGLLPTARTAQIVGMVVLYPMLILSGAAWPRELMPAAVQNISAYLPLTYVVNLLRGLWMGESWSLHLLDVVILGGMLLVGIVISLKTFRWE